MPVYASVTSSCPTIEYASIEYCVCAALHTSYTPITSYLRCITNIRYVCKQIFSKCKQNTTEKMRIHVKNRIIWAWEEEQDKTKRQQNPILLKIGMTVPRVYAASFLWLFVCLLCCASLLQRLPRPVSWYSPSTFSTIFRYFRLDQQKQLPSQYSLFFLSSLLFLLNNFDVAQVYRAYAGDIEKAQDRNG